MDTLYKKGQRTRVGGGGMGMVTEGDAGGRDKERKKAKEWVNLHTHKHFKAKIGKFHLRARRYTRYVTEIFLFSMFNTVPANHIICFQIR